MNNNKTTQNSTKIGNIKLTIFMTISNILILSEVGFYSFFTPFKHTSWIALLIYIGITFILSIIFKGFPNDTGIIKIINKVAPTKPYIEVKDVNMKSVCGSGKYIGVLLKPCQNIKALPIPLSALVSCIPTPSFQSNNLSIL